MIRTLRAYLGFSVLVVTLLGTIAFFAWGLSTPPLDQVWRMQIELAVGDRPALDEGELRTLRETLVRHPEVADAFLKGSDHGVVSSAHLLGGSYAYLIRRAAGEPATLEIALDRSPRSAGAQIEARTGSDHRRGAVSDASPLLWKIGDEGPFPQLIEVRFRAQSGAAAGSTPPALRIQLRDSP
jgi:hypothetical protein